MQLREYQQELFGRIHDAIRRKVRNPLVVSPTGSGKTVLFCYIANRTATAGNRAVILVHRKELVTQTSQTLTAFGINHGIIQAGITPDPRHMIQVAMVQTIARRLDRIPAPNLIICDECFPPGTMIGDRPIESIKQGEFVSSFNHHSNKIEQRKVEGIMSRSYTGSWYRLVDSDGRSFVCTENHPVFLIGTGYIAIKSLPTHGDNASFLTYAMPTLREDQKSRQIQQKTRLQILLTAMFGSVFEINNGGNAIARNAMSFLRKPCKIYKQETRIRKNAGRASFLLSRVFVGIQKKIFIRNDDEHKQSNEVSNIHEDDIAKSYAEPRKSQKNANQHVRKDVFITRRKWTTNKATTSCPPCDRITNGVSNFNSWGKLSESSILLQGGFGGGGSEVVDRDRREITSPEDLEIPRSPQNRGVGISRMESIEIYQRGSGPKPKWVPESDTVHNIHVDGNENYFANGILVHNCHHMAAGGYKAVVNAFPDAHLIGFTATPQRLDGKGLSECFSEIIHGPEVEWLMSQGFLSRPKYYAPPIVADMRGVKKRMGDYAQAESAMAMDRPTITGDAVKHYRKLCDGVPAVAFCVTVDHAKHVAEYFRENGIPADTIHAGMTGDERKKIVADLGNGTIKVMTSCDIVSEGFDLPIVGAAILLRPTTSLGLHLQQIGRVLRPSPGKTHSTILDHVGNLIRHGLAEDDRVWSLEGNAKRAKASEALGLKQCPECFALHPPGPECSECGFVYPPPKAPKQIEQVAGELLEFTREKISLNNALKLCKTRKDLKTLAKARGYKPGWVYYMAKELNLH
jgi:superfamily II DNA or RNA helicase